MNLKIWFLLFIIYSIVGWLIEVCLNLYTNKKFVNRGFLIGPWCTIYGWGAILMTFLLREYSGDLAVLFLMSVFICAVLEYFTSFFMEVMFNTRWWDYSNYKYNINGRICLETMIPFGLLGCFMMYISNPILISLLYKIPDFLLTALTVIILIIFLIDNIISFSIIFRLNIITKDVRNDYTEEITKKVKEILLSKNLLHKRIVHAFPNMKTKPKRKK